MAKLKPWPAAALTAALSMLAGCTLIKGTLQLPDMAIQALLPFTRGDSVPDAVELQSKLIRFADHLLYAVTTNMRNIERDGQKIGKRELVRRRINYTNQVLAITTGSNAFANLMDMVVLVSLTRMRVENYWSKESRSADVSVILKVFRQFEAEVRRISASVLSPEQQQELDSSLANWLQKNPKLRMTPDMTDLDFVSEIRDFSRVRRNGASTSVFNLLMIDPLSGLDPAAKELAETRLMAERALFLSRHLPELIRWQTEYLSMNVAELPQSAQLLETTSKLSDSAAQISGVAQKLPELIAQERAELVTVLKSERQGLTTLAAESRQALTAGKQMADSANATLASFQAILKQIESQPKDPNAEPFRIAEYTAAARQIGETSQRLSQLLDLFNRTIGPDNAETLATRLDEVTRRAETSGRDLVDYAYRKALIGSTLIFAIATAFALAYRVLSLRLGRAAARPPPT